MTRLYTVCWRRPRALSGRRSVCARCHADRQNWQAKIRPEAKAA